MTGPVTGDAGGRDGGHGGGPAGDTSPPVALDAPQARVLGCLVEKAATTPDQYPLSLAALVSACNQRTNRDPVVEYDPRRIEAALDALRGAGLVRRIKATGQRVVKYRHVVDEALGLDDAGRALLALLLLRGPQTPGELRSRAARLHPFEDLAAVESALGALAARDLVGTSPRRPGQKEVRWHERLTVDVHGSPPAEDTPAPAPPEAGGPEGHSPAAAAPPGPAATALPGPAAATSPGVERALVVRDPATGDEIARLAVDGPRDVAGAIARARAAQPGWAGRPYPERAEVVAALAGALAQDAEAAAATLTAETGKPVTAALAEVRAAVERIEWFVAHAGEVLAPRTVTATDRLVEEVTVDPLGVVAHVSAWNYPYFVGLATIVPALLTGNAVCYKPSELATLTGRQLARYAHGAGVPADVFTLVVGGAATGAALVDAPVDLVCFTGSVATGRRVAAAVAPRLGRVQLELGGTDPVYVCDDVDVEAAADAVVSGACYHGGQSCCAVERVYVHRSIHAPFVEAVAERVRVLRVGDPTDPATDVGPLARPGHDDLLEAQVADALDWGARAVVAGGRREGPGRYFDPVVLDGCDESMRVVREETFGPVVPIAAVADDAEAVARMDDTDFGLTAAVFGRDPERARAVLARLDTGSAYWNCADRTAARLPWSGRRDSGLGVSMGLEGLRAMTRPRAWYWQSP